MGVNHSRTIVASCLLSIVVWLTTAHVGFGSEDLATAEHRISRMSPTQQARLAHRQKQFAALPTEKQRRLRQLHRQIEKSPNASKLRSVMHRYAQWLQTLPPDLRAELLDLPPKERIDRVIELKAHPPHMSNAQVASQLAHMKKDMKTLMRWSEAFVETHESKIISSLPRDRQMRLESADPTIRRQMVLMMLLRHLQMGGVDGDSKMLKKELANLRSKLSPKAQKALASKSPSEQWQIIGSLVGKGLTQRSSHRMPGQNTHLIVPEELLYFFEHKLSVEQQDQLLRLPGEQMQEKLRQLYLQQTKPRFPGPPRRGQPGPTRRGELGPMYPRYRPNR